MTRPWVERLKPAAPARVHLLLAALMWSGVGGTLLVFGTVWVLRDRNALDVVLIAAAVGAGWLKSRFVLQRAAHRIAERIETRGDGRCIGGFLSLPTWGMVAVMSLAGRVARSGVISRHAIGLIYILVGIALVLASRTLWRAVSRYHVSR